MAGAYLLRFGAVAFKARNGMSFTLPRALGQHQFMLGLPRPP